jgi:hypothetical protein
MFRSTGGASSRDYCSGQLDQIDGQQRGVQKQDRVNMAERAIAYEENVAQNRDRTKRYDRRHTKADEDGQCGCKSYELIPVHRPVLEELSETLVPVRFNFSLSTILRNMPGCF